MPVITESTVRGGWGGEAGGRMGGGWGKEGGGGRVKALDSIGTAH